MGNAPVPPHNLDAEESVLGAMMLARSAIHAAAEETRPEDFYRPSHEAIFSAAVGLDARGEPVDAITLTAELERLGKLQDAGGQARIHELATLVPAASNARHYARLVAGAARRRSLIDAGGNIARLGWEGNGSTDHLIQSAERELDSATRTVQTGDFDSLGDSLGELYDEVSLAVETSKPIFGMKTGFPDLDALTTGFYPGQLVVIAARPGVGKSVLALNISENLAGREEPVAFFTLEMSNREIALRSAVRATKLDMNRLRTGKVSQQELATFKLHLEKLRERPLFVEDNPGITLTELRARARRLKQKKGLSLLVVDYLQLMVDGSSTESRNNQVAQISRNLKLLAKELQVPVIAVSQLNRNNEYRQDKRPTLADLRDSGAIEQDADIVLFIYREEVHKIVDPEKGGDAELIVAKNRMGAQDTVNLLFLGRRQTFATPARVQDTEAEAA